MPNQLITTRKKTPLYRFFEIVPGLLTWLTLTLALLLSAIAPVWIAVFIILFDMYWLFKAGNIAVHLLFTHRKIRLHAHRPWRAWLARLKDIPQFMHYLEELRRTARASMEKEDLDEQRDRLRRLGATTNSVEYRNLYQVIILPTYQEPLAVLQHSIDSYAASDYPLDRLILVVACEERAGEEAVRVGDAIKKRYEGVFHRLLVTLHPDGIVGEAKTKGANITYAARQVTKLIDELQIPRERVIVSAFDADTVVARQYFSQLAYTYLTVEAPTRASYQPVPMYNNNVWDAPAINRLVAANSSFWQMVETSRADRLVTFSSHSISLQALIEVDYWPVDVVSEDSQIFWRCFLHYHGDYRTEPLFTTVSLDAVVLESYTQSLLAQYKQNRRWAWGIVDFPYLVSGLLHNSLIPVWKKFLYAYRLLEGHYFWATAAIMIAVLGWLPLALGGDRIENQVFAVNLPSVTSLIMTVSTLFLVLNVLLYLRLLPPRPAHHSRLKFILFIIQWALIPAAMILFASLPAIDAQTRLMFGRYMEFWVTPKVRKSSQQIVASS